MKNTIQSYAEASYFDGYAFAHIAAFEEERRLARKRRAALEASERRRGSRSRFRFAL